MPLTGSCLCGDVRFEIQGELEPLCHCHCSMCRKSHGAAFASFVGTGKSGFRWLRGADATKRYASSPGAFRPFCGRCGSIVPAAPESMDRVFVPAGLLAEDPRLAPLPHFFVASKAPWYTIPDSQPQFDEYPSGMGEGVPSPRKTEPTPEAVRGGCLCGAVAWETPRPVAGPIFLCHCNRCRRARAAAHGANLFVELERFRWLRGAERVERYKVPEAERFAQAFCRDCGSKVPSLGRRAVIPAGSLDDDPGVRPAMHVYVASKAPWFEICDDLPRYPEQAPS
ncbi:MAG TPA: GFA family protein [Myxococcota bacterium]|nr:GFA family protein [Myxococcota bacterium]